MGADAESTGRWMQETEGDVRCQASVCDQFTIFLLMFKNSIKGKKKNKHNRQTLLFVVGLLLCKRGLV